MEWHMLENFGLARRPDSEMTPMEVKLHLMAPVIRRICNYSVDRWFDSLHDRSVEGMFLDYVAEFVGIGMAGGMTAVHLCGSTTNKQGEKFYEFLAQNGLRHLVVVSPGLKTTDWRKFTGMEVLYLPEDPLRFLFRLEPGPSILFHPFYQPDIVGRDYYQALARETHRVTNGQVNIRRTLDCCSSGYPIVAGYLPEFFEEVLPQSDEEPPFVGFEAVQGAYTEDNDVLALAFRAQ